jgi:hypothetical protein
MSGMWRSRWAAVGAAVAITLGAGGLGIARATTSSGAKPIYKPITPCRLADTRPAPDNVGGRAVPLGPEESYTLSGWGAVGNCTATDLPSGTSGLALNVTAVAPSQATYLTVYPTGASLPLASNLNPTPGEPPTPNAVNVDLDGSGQFDVFNKFGSVHVVVDVVGYYDDHNHDDRYYQQSAVDTALGAKADAVAVYTKVQADAQAVEAVVPTPVIDAFFDFDFVIEATSTQLVQSFTTDRDGRLAIDLFYKATVACDLGQDSRIVFITLDGQPVPSSALLRRALGPIDVEERLSGVTDDVVAAGAHTIGIGAECSSASTATTYNVNVFSTSSVLVIPDR